MKKLLLFLVLLITAAILCPNAAYCQAHKKTDTGAKKTTGDKTIKKSAKKKTDAKKEKATADSINTAYGLIVVTPLTDTIKNDTTKAAMKTQVKKDTMASISVKEKPACDLDNLFPANIIAGTTIVRLEYGLDAFLASEATGQYDHINLDSKQSKELMRIFEKEQNLIPGDLNRSCAFDPDFMIRFNTGKLGDPNSPLVILLSSSCREFMVYDINRKETICDRSFTEKGYTQLNSFINK